jgi:hypothetical protein
VPYTSERGFAPIFETTAIDASDCTAGASPAIIGNRKQHRRLTQTPLQRAVS